MEQGDLVMCVQVDFRYYVFQWLLYAFYSSLFTWAYLLLLSAAVSLLDADCVHIIYYITCLFYLKVSESEELYPQNSNNGVFSISRFNLEDYILDFNPDAVMGNDFLRSSNERVYILCVRGMWMICGQMMFWARFCLKPTNSLQFFPLKDGIYFFTPWVRSWPYGLLWTINH